MSLFVRQPLGRVDLCPWVQGPPRHEVNRVRNTTILRRGIAAIAALALAGSLASCAQSQRETGTTTEEGSGGGDFVFAGLLRPGDAGSGAGQRR